MKKILFSLLFVIISVTAWSQTTYKSIKAYKQDKSTIVKDSTGAILGPEVWFAKVQSGEYTLDPLTAEADGKPEFSFRKSTVEERRRFAEANEKRAPITLAGFTTGKPLSEFTVTDINNKTYTNASFAGKILIINFWYKDAAACKAEIPDLNKLVAKYKSKNVVFLAPTYEPLDDVKEFLKKTPFNYIICTDVDDMIINMKITKYPTHVVVDSEGIVTYVTIGQTGNVIETLNKEIDALL